MNAQGKVIRSTIHWGQVRTVIPSGEEIITDKDGAREYEEQRWDDMIRFENARKRANGQ